MNPEEIKEAFAELERTLRGSPPEVLATPEAREALAAVERGRAILSEKELYRALRIASEIPAPVRAQQERMTTAAERLRGGSAAPSKGGSAAGVRPALPPTGTILVRAALKVGARGHAPVTAVYEGGWEAELRPAVLENSNAFQLSGRNVSVGTVRYRLVVKMPTAGSARGAWVWKPWRITPDGRMTWVNIHGVAATEDEAMHAVELWAETRADGGQRPIPGPRPEVAGWQPMRPSGKSLLQAGEYMHAGNRSATVAEWIGEAGIEWTIVEYTPGGEAKIVAHGRATTHEEAMNAVEKAFAPSGGPTPSGEPVGASAASPAASGAPLGGAAPVGGVAPAGSAAPAGGSTEAPAGGVPSTAGAAK